jgi:hypothetical protein
MMNPSRGRVPAVVAAAIALAAAIAAGAAPPRRDEADMRRRLAAYAEVRLPADLSGLKNRDREALARIVAAVAVVDELYWRQMGRPALDARRRFEGARDPIDLLVADYVRINYGPFDRRAGNERFVEAGGAGPRPPGAGFYPEDMTREEFEARLEAHPEQRPEFERRDTLIRRVDGRLVAIPYEKIFLDELKTASAALAEAATLVDHAGLRRYLSRRSTALLSGDYYSSDIAWLEMQDAPVDAVIGPIETYDDGLLGLKASYAGAALVRDARGSRSLEAYRRHLPGMAAALPVEPRYRAPRAGEGSLPEVMNVVRFAGDFNAGIKTVAASLPGDERVLHRKGSKKQLYRNVLEAKFDTILLPIARLVLPKKDQDLVTREAFVTNVLLHELAHALGAETVAGAPGLTVRRALRERHGAIDEAKADAVGLFCLQYLRDQEMLTEEEVGEGYATYLTGLVRAARFGPAEPHGQASAMQIGWLLRAEAIEHDPKKGVLAVHPRRFEPAIARLAKELLEIQGRGDYEAAGAFLEEFGRIGPDLRAVIDRIDGVPVDVVLIYPM